MSKAVDEALQAAQSALGDAYGRSQATPDGMYCRIGRIDRAYDIAVQRGNPENALIAIRKMQVDAQAAFDEFNKAVVNYRRLCRLEGATEQDIDVQCDCPSCRRVQTFGGVEL